ncbi:DNA replication protein [Exophiala xenobiotica]|uniref:DNA replication complex GINS protein PSF3 n=1 Tax=Vermiconidia calcicola TaxID=1690605 RepID=A0AAV9Q7Z4_9PEZI|nr:DNA replication protein [Exophiala xenobiotica]KAK5534757.1 DNA replication protein [Chaetothyriales sp. CCFEE 6169]KAK5535162.1 DNA replication protein [Vermiconidia calcicola]KAK5273562.1 DNA replication protein [Exophiala xenobiotica]KAK5377941.1 DNA replication protein [Exophiala xenobiotica]
MSYYDVDAILTDTQKLPCTFQLDVPGLGYLDGNAGGTASQATEKGRTKAYSETGQSWHDDRIAHVVGCHARSVNRRVINALKANPRTVDLRAQAPHYYALGARIMELFEDQAVLDTLLDTFKSRASEIADQAHNPRGALGDGADFLRGLEESERQLFKAAHEGPKAVKAWTQDLRKST